MITANRAVTSVLCSAKAPRKVFAGGKSGWIRGVARVRPHPRLSIAGLASLAHPPPLGNVAQLFLCEASDATWCTQQTIRPNLGRRTQLAAMYDTTRQHRSVRTSTISGDNLGAIESTYSNPSFRICELSSQRRPAQEPGRRQPAHVAVGHRGGHGNRIAGTGARRTR